VEQSQSDASPEPKIRETEQDAPVQPVVLAGVFIGMTRVSAVESVRKELGQTQAEFDLLRPEQKGLFNRATYLLGESGTELVLYFEGVGPDAQMIGAFWKADERDIDRRALAFLQEFKSLGLETKNSDGAILAGDQKRS